MTWAGTSGICRRNREIVLYCTCPSEASAARVAKVLVNHGFKRVRPLYRRPRCLGRRGLRRGSGRSRGEAEAGGAARQRRLERGRDRPLSRRRHHVVIVGGGFGGLAVAQGLAGAPVRITIVDQRNHHLFQPLLYQVGTATLATSEIAWPIRQLMRKRKEITTLLGDGDRSRRRSAARCCSRTAAQLAYDTLVLATGARHAYFGHDEWEPYAPGAQDAGGRDLDPAAHPARVRARRARDRRGAPRRAWLTFVIVGGGATGVELAGAIAELAHVTLPDEFRHIDTRKARVLLIEAGPRILPTLHRGSVRLRARRARAPRRGDSARARP